MYKVDKGIPLTKKGKNEAKYPFSNMEVGDSFFVPDSEEVKRATVAAAAYTAGLRMGRKFTVMAADGGIRIWRTE